MKPVLPIQIPRCGRRPAAIGALTEALKTHQRPFVLLMKESDRHELVATVNQMTDRLGLITLILDANDTTSLKSHLLSKEQNLIVIVESATSRLPLGMQELILERYEPPQRDEAEIRKLIKAKAKPREIQDLIPKAHPPAGLLVVTDTDPGELCERGIWSREFTTLKHFTLLWDPMTRRLDAYEDVFKAGVAIAAKDLKVDVTKRVDDEAVRRYARMQKILANHEKRARERGMTLRAHESVAEVLDAARDCVLYLSNGADRRINNDVVEALVYKGVTELALRATFGLELPKKSKSRLSLGPDAPFLPKQASGE